jgi:hypothetical protein
MQLDIRINAQAMNTQATIVQLGGATRLVHRRPKFLENEGSVAGAPEAVTGWLGSSVALVYPLGRPRRLRGQQ